MKTAPIYNDRWNIPIAVPIARKLSQRKWNFEATFIGSKGPIILAIIGIGMICLFAPDVGILAPDRSPRSPQGEEGNWRRLVDRMLVTSILTEVNAEQNSARAHFGTWMRLDIRKKQNIVKTLSMYFKEERGYKRVTILSSLNDQKLASYSEFSGITIYR